MVNVASKDQVALGALGCGESSPRPTIAELHIAYTALDIAKGYHIRKLDIQLFVQKDDH